MPLDPCLRSLDLTLPACPSAVLKLAQLMPREDVSVRELAAVVEGDMALAAAVMRTVNSAMFGVLRRVETVGEAVLFLGMREVAAITCEQGLRAAFPVSPAMNQLWDQARLRSLLMGRCADALGVHAWQAQSAGLFAQVGQAALMAHDPARHAALQAALPGGASPADLATAERERFGVDHAVLGSALCRVWGLAAAVADHVRDRPLSPSAWATRPHAVKSLLHLGQLVDTCMADPAALETTCAGLGDAPWSVEQAQATVLAQWQRLLTGQEPLALVA